jgi:hypothetical protein
MSERGLRDEESQGPSFVGRSARNPGGFALYAVICGLAAKAPESIMGNGEPYHTMDKIGDVTYALAAGLAIWALTNRHNERKS